jgi:hypothetical protein
VTRSLLFLSWFVFLVSVLLLLLWVSLKDATAFMRRRLLLVPAFTALAFVLHPSVLKHMLVSRR